MTTVASDILAASDFESLAYTIVVAVVMGIGAIMSSAKKKQKEMEQRQRHQENWERIEQEMRERAANAARVLSQQQPGAYPQAPPPPVPSPYPQNVPPPPPPVFAPTRTIDGPYVPPRPRPAPRRPVPPPVRAQPPRPVQTSRPQPRRPKHQTKGGRAVAVTGGEIPPLPTEAPMARVAEAPPVARKVPPVPAANAAAIANWLSAKTLRSQFILTEILQPPLALREPSDRQV